MRRCPKCRGLAWRIGSRGAKGEEIEVLWECMKCKHQFTDSELNEKYQELQKDNASLKRRNNNDA